MGVKSINSHSIIQPQCFNCGNEWNWVNWVERLVRREWLLAHVKLVYFLCGAGWFDCPAASSAWTYCWKRKRNINGFNEFNFIWIHWIGEQMSLLVKWFVFFFNQWSEFSRNTNSLNWMEAASTHLQQLHQPWLKAGCCWCWVDNYCYNNKQTQSIQSFASFAKIDGFGVVCLSFHQPFNFFMFSPAKPALQPADEKKGRLDWWCCLQLLHQSSTIFLFSSAGWRAEQKTLKKLNH